MTITLNPTPEQQDALSAVVATANASLGEDATPYTSETYLAMLLEKSLTSYVRTAYEQSLQRLGNAAATLPYADRLALIAQVESAIP